MTDRTDIVGMYCHVWGLDQKIQRQGRIVSRVGDAHYLVQWYSWLDASPNTMHVYALETMRVAEPGEENFAGAWQFYETAEAWNAFADRKGN